MALQSGLAIWAYNPNIAATPLNLAPLLSEMSFASSAPGGPRDFTGKLYLKDARLPLAALALFNRLSIISPATPSQPSQCVWQGEITDPELGLNDMDGEYLQIGALGLSNAVQDDPISTSYIAQTTRQIAIDQLTGTHGGLVRTNFLPFDADTSALFPDLPATTYSPVYPNYTMQDVFANLCVLAGDYQWGVWPHPTGMQPNSAHKDAAGYPSAQVQIHLRDTSTIHYSASEAAQDVVSWRVIQSAQRAYNVIQIAYNDPAQSPPVGIASYVDPRLAANGGIGTASFRRRVYFRDLSGVSTVTLAQAQAIANAYGALFKNPTNKIEVVLRGVRDAAGTPQPIWTPWADKNIFIPTLSVRGQQLPTTAIAGTNLFYIVEAKYEESGGDAALILQCDNFVDTVETVVSRLQLQSDVQNRAGNRTTGAVQAQGATITGFDSFEFSNATAGAHVGVGASYPAVAAQAPVSVTLATTLSNNCGTPTASDYSVRGNHIFVTVTANGGGYWKGSWQTNGNCILDADGPDDPRGRFTHHCGVCGTVRKGLTFKRDLVVHRRSEADTDHNALKVECPICAPLADGTPRVVESYNCGLGPEDEDPDAPGNWPWRAQQARLIRTMMAHPHVNLPRREHAHGAGAGVAPAASRRPSTATRRR